MKTICVLLAALSMPAMALDYTTVVVGESATNVVADLTNNNTYRTYMVENGGSSALYCSRDPSVTVDTGHKIAANDGWRFFPNDGPLYCVAAVAQTGTDRSHTIVWGSYQ